MIRKLRIAGYQLVRRFWFCNLLLSNKLLSSWLGPFPITKVFHPDYRVLVKGKEKVFHANMLKRYVRREDAADVAVGGLKCVQSVEDFVPWSEISPLLDVCSQGSFYFLWEFSCC